MSQTNPEPVDIISPELYGLILTSHRLKERLLPEGFVSSPYEILDYEASLTLHDEKGMRATFDRSQRVRFLQDGVSAILDHLWGVGVSLTHYHNDAGTLEDSLRDGRWRHLVIGLRRAMGKGEELSFGVQRTAMLDFLRDDEWLETKIDHPIARLRQVIRFPAERPCREAALHCDGYQIPLPVIKQSDGTTLVRFEVLRPRSHRPYTLHWSW